MFKGPGPGRPKKYTRELVEPLAKKATNFYELALSLGLGWISTQKTQPRVREIVQKTGVSVSHFTKKRPGADYAPVLVSRPPKKIRKKRVRCRQPTLEQAVREGKQVKDIALQIGVTESTVYIALKRFGLSKPKPKYAPEKYRRKYTRKLLEPHLATCRTFHDLAIAIGEHPRIASTLKVITRKLGLDTQHFIRKPHKLHIMTSGPSWKRGRFGRNGDKTWRDILVLHPTGVDTSGEKLKAALLCSGRTYVCEVCEIPPEWNGFSLNLQIDHINGLGWDDRPENLRFICPNCHSQTDTFCGKNVARLRQLGVIPAARRPRMLWVSRGGRSE